MPARFLCPHIAGVSTAIGPGKTNGMTAIYIDADACPVKDEVLRVADRHKTQVFIVSNGGLRPNHHPLVQNIIVPEGPDVADDWIAERAGKNDVVITGDIPLASRCIATGARVLQHTGEIFTPENIGHILATRDLMTDLRSANPLMQGSGKSFTRADRSRFLDALEREMRAVE